MNSFGTRKAPMVRLFLGARPTGRKPAIELDVSEDRLEVVVPRPSLHRSVTVLTTDTREEGLDELTIVRVERQVTCVAPETSVRRHQSDDIGHGLRPLERQRSVAATEPSVLLERHSTQVRPAATRGRVPRETRIHRRGESLRPVLAHPRISP